MSVLYMVRHAQASFGSDDYDCLSSLGFEQSAALGRAWCERGVMFDEVVIGPRLRHRQTAETVADQYTAAGLAWPEAVRMDAFNEHAVDQAISFHLEELIAQQPELASLAEAAHAAEEGDELKRRFLVLLQRVMVLWAAERLVLPNAETWAQFNARVGGGIDEIVSGGSGRRVVVFSSVGPVTATMHRALLGDPGRSMQIGWRIRNASVTRFVFDRERFTLDGFNDVSHLTGNDALTFL